MKKVLLFILCFTFLLSPSKIFPNEKGKIGRITGKVVQKKDQKELSLVSVILIEKNSKNILGFASSDNEGKYSIKNPGKGVYQVKLSLVGYKSEIVDSFEVASATAIVDLGTITMESGGLTTDEVEVTGEKNDIEIQAGKMVLNVDKLKLADSESADELLERAPFVMVMENGIKVKGIPVSKVHLNGNKSGRDAMTLLKTTLAEKIDKIEVITNPSAKYDAEGEGL